jgi:hypothetical protein
VSRLRHAAIACKDETLLLQPGSRGKFSGVSVVKQTKAVSS